MRVSGLVAVSLILCSCDPPLVMERTGAIINGTSDPGHPAVGLLLVGAASGSGCTATLIGPRTVLTAAHCVTTDDIYNKPPPYTPEKSLVFSFALSDAPQFPVESVMMRSDFNGSVEDPSEGSTDLAVVRLAQPVPGVKPMIVAAQPPSVGEAITIVGFGITSSADMNTGTSWGTKRMTQNLIARTTPTSLIYLATSGGSICYGDSGGPSFAVRDGELVLVGVHAYFPNEALAAQNTCEVGGLDTRVDAYHAWIEQQSQGDLAKPDKLPPQATILAPHEGAVVASSVEVEVGATDNLGVASVALQLDGKPLAELAAAPFRFSLTGVAPGAHRLRATATDTAGLSSSTEIGFSVAASSGGQPAGPQPAQPGQPGQPGHASEWIGGCSLAPRIEAAPALLFLPLLFALLFWIRRERCQARPRRDPAS